MKIAIITLGVYPFQIGGTEIQSYKLVQRLTEKGHEVVCFTRKKSSDRTASTLPGARVERVGPTIPVLGQLAFLSIVSWRLFRMRRLTDVVQVYYATYFVIPAYILSALCGTPYVVSCRGSDLRDWGKSRFWSGPQKFLLRRAAFVTVLSEEMKQTVVGSYGLSEERVVLAPNVVDEREIKNVPGPSTAKSGNRRLIFLGNLKPVKDPMTAVRAFALLSRKTRQVELEVIGDGPMRDEILSLASSDGVSGSILMKGELSHEDSLAELRKADALVITSISEGSPNAVVEAMALGVPVIGTNIGGIRDLVTDGQTGLLVPPMSPELLADAAYRILEDRELARSIANEAKKRVEDLTWEKQIERVEKMYESAVKERHA